MKARLTTRCGCTREVETEWPPVEWVKIPLMPRLEDCSKLPDPKATVEFREFQMVKVVVKGANGLALYEEV